MPWEWPSLSLYLPLSLSPSLPLCLSLSFSPLCWLSVLPFYCLLRILVKLKTNCTWHTHTYNHSGIYRNAKGHGSQMAKQAHDWQQQQQHESRANQPIESGVNPQPTAARHLHCIWHLHSTPFSLTSPLFPQPSSHSFTFSSSPSKCELRVSFIRSALASSSTDWAKDVVRARAKVSATHSRRVHHLLWHCCGSPGSVRSFECIHECSHALAAQQQTHNLPKLSCWSV